MKRDFKIWAVILGILIAGCGITLMTNSYVSNKREQLKELSLYAGADTEPEMEAAKSGAEANKAEISGAEETRLAVSGRASDMDKEALMGEADMGAPIPAQGQDGNLDAREKGQEEKETAPAAAKALPSEFSRAAAGGWGDTEGIAQAAGEEDALLETALSEDAKESPSPIHAKLMEYKERFQELDAQIQKMRSLDGENTVQSVRTTARTEQQIWERELDAVYAFLLESLDEEQGEELRSRQQEWIKARDSEALNASKKSGGGSLESVEYIASIAASNRGRAYELIEHYRNVDFVLEN